MQKGIKDIFKIGALSVAIKLGAAYTFSDKIGYWKNDICETLNDSLGKKEILCDQETNDIINLMSGKITQENFNALLARHGYANANTNIEKLIDPDEALYKTILEIQTKYTNPKISFSGFLDNMNIETGESEPERPRYNIFSNIIHLHQLDAKILQFKNMNQEDKFWAENMMGLKSYVQETRQKYLLNNWKTETAHAPQLKEKGCIKMGIDGLVDYLGTRSTDNWMTGVKKMFDDQQLQEEGCDKTGFSSIISEARIRYMHDIISGIKKMTHDKQLKEKGDIKIALDSIINNAGTRYTDNVTLGIKGMTHNNRLQETGRIKILLGSMIGYAWMGLDYGDTYDEEGDLESDAHKTIQLEIIQDFIETYKKYADLDNPDHVFMLAKLYRGFFTTYQNGRLLPYKDTEKSAFYLNILENMGHKFSSYRMGRYYQGIYDKEYDHKLYGCDRTTDTLKVDINGDTITRVELFEKFIWYYEKSYRQGNINAGFDILYIINTHRRGQYDNLVLHIGGDMLKRHKNEFEPKTLGEIYKILGSVYYHKGNKKKGEKYYKLANKIILNDAL